MMVTFFLMTVIMTMTMTGIMTTRMIVISIMISITMMLVIMMRVGEDRAGFSVPLSHGLSVFCAGRKQLLIC